MLGSGFQTVLNMSITGSLVILVVMAARFFLKKAPKIFSYALWAVVLFRLLCPVSPEASFSALQPLPTPQSEAGRLEYVTVTPPAVAAPPVQQPQTPVETPTVTTPAPRKQVDILPLLWIAGAVGVAGWNLFQLLRLRRRLVGAVLLEKGVYEADHIVTPFVLGMIRPRIYLPSTLKEQQRAYILLHERHHIRRGDPWLKLLGFAALCLHWFNPLVWLAFFLAVRDMEMSCDEAVMRRMSGDIRADYSQSLLQLSTGQRLSPGTPLAFGEGDTRKRIINVMKYKKPALWLTVLGVALCLILTACLLTNPDRQEQPDPIETAEASEATEATEPVPTDPPGTLEALLAALTEQDLKDPDDIQRGVLALLNKAPQHYMATIPGEQEYYELSLKLNSQTVKPEQVILTAGVIPDRVKLTYYDGKGFRELRGISDPELYQYLLNTHRTEDHFEDHNYERYKALLEAKAEEILAQTVDADGKPVFTGCETLSFVPSTVLDSYQLFFWDVAYLTDRLEDVEFTEGMFLDEQFRVRRVGDLQFFVVRRDESGGEQYFFLTEERKNDAMSDPRVLDDAYLCSIGTPMTWEEVDAFQQVINANKGNNDHARFLFDLYETPEQVDLETLCSFRLSTHYELTDEERGFLQGIWLDYEYDGRVRKIPARELDKLLQKHLGVSLDMVPFKESDDFVYWDESDCFYLKFLEYGPDRGWPLITEGYYMPDGTMRVYALNKYPTVAAVQPMGDYYRFLYHIELP